MIQELFGQTLSLDREVPRLAAKAMQSEAFKKLAELDRYFHGEEERPQGDRGCRHQG
jgi:hypothetical protein